MGLTALVQVLIFSATSENLSRSPAIFSLAASSFDRPSSPFSSTKMCLTRAYRGSVILSSIPLKSKPIDSDVDDDFWASWKDSPCKNSGNREATLAFIECLRSSWFRRPRSKDDYW